MHSSASNFRLTLTANARSLIFAICGEGVCTDTVGGRANQTPGRVSCLDTGKWNQPARHRGRTSCLDWLAYRFLVCKFGGQIELYTRTRIPTYARIRSQSVSLSMSAIDDRCLKPCSQQTNWTELTWTKLTQLHDALLVTHVSVTKLIGCRAAVRALQFAKWTQAQKSLGSNRSRDAVG